MVANFEFKCCDFSKAIEKYFQFLVTDHGFIYRGVMHVDEDPRDSYYLARFNKGEERIEVCWSDLEKMLSIMFKLANKGLERRECFVYFEPFIEFVSEETLTPIVPQYYKRMTMRQTNSVMRQRDRLFGGGVETILKRLAERLQSNVNLVRCSSPDIVRSYHVWYNAK